MFESERSKQLSVLTSVFKWRRNSANTPVRDSTDARNTHSWVERNKKSRMCTSVAEVVNVIAHVTLHINKLQTLLHVLACD